MPSSSWSSRMSAASGISPACALPPGNSHSPASGLPAGRWASSTRPSLSTSATATTRPTRRARRGGALNVDGDQLLGALAVADDELRQLDQHLLEGAAELAQMRIANGLDSRVIRGGAGGAEQHGVAGRGVAVDGDRVEGA